MPKRYGVKEKDLVVAHVLDLLLTGRLRSGDRVDRNEIAAALGLSRVPVQEALVQLEHDGILETRYHRGAFVHRFDADVLREHHEVHGLLTGAVSARAATNPRGPALEALDRAMVLMRNAGDPREYLDAANLFRDVVVDEYAGPRLKAAVSASRSFMPQEFWATHPDAPAQLMPLAETEFAAIRGGHPGAARQSCLDRTDLMADVLTVELCRRGVFADLDSV
ncbi:DNA-binding GntR family transcriptional regulator [Mycolicibacterium sp. BK556]|uniref:GntR family transcriptional regulator n=1 Tax=Mycobacteriaceae TaxID=1762 RepID=UPI001061FBC8|nr:MULTISPECIES: GntR family transcriptional regulator [Mycobacteriaceae]MBB3601079.1 DNA-binding GntR family transcriptional regulator [Mycolicibacterium sp. BK556]MBB3630833.1 DNA-binding GntR family transcriptional regulator [Mycolicibacterium sp. BK607]MBB3748829.1 DNA-binding GntR family transcriptional regulator [Mycolicibacterium sp. BK634]TDO14957.1 DNA-binding GntR family transcriptional regulator [Mycobacterium sp. BK086]